MRSKLARNSSTAKGYLGSTDWGAILNTVNDVAGAASNVANAAGTVINQAKNISNPSPSNPNSYLNMMGGDTASYATPAPPAPAPKADASDNTTLYLVGGGLLALGTLYMLTSNGKKRK